MGLGRSTMSATEFAKVRERLGATASQIALNHGVSPSEVLNWERGTAVVPRTIADELRHQAALATYEQVLEASGLPRCGEADALIEAVENVDGAKELSVAIDALEEHSEQCPICRARAEYAERHGAPLPRMELSRWLKVLGAVIEFPNRLPRRLRPPKGVAGEGRRRGLVTAAFLSLFVVGLVAWMSIMQLAVGVRPPGWWRESLRVLAIVVPTYFAGLYMAGAVFDATRSIQHRFVGYAVRGALATSAFYGIIGLAIPAIDPSASFAHAPVFAAGAALVGTVAGAVLWLWERILRKVRSVIDA